MVFVFVLFFLVGWERESWHTLSLFGKQYQPVLLRKRIESQSRQPCKTFKLHNFCIFAMSYLVCTMMLVVYVCSFEIVQHFHENCFNALCSVCYLFAFQEMECRAKTLLEMYGKITKCIYKRTTTLLTYTRTLHCKTCTKIQT